MSDPRKQHIAKDLVRKAIGGINCHIDAGPGRVCGYLATKLSPAALPNDVLAILNALGPIRLILPDGATVRRAVEARAS